MGVHGTARFATRRELVDAGLLGGWTPGAPADGLMLGWWYEDRFDFEPIVYRGDLHQLIVGGTGGGKFTTALAPLLLGSGLAGSTVVAVDPKGEIARLAAPLFQKPFAEMPSVFVLDPWDLCGTGASASLNVLDELTPENPNYVDDARALADAMIIPSGAENTHWDNAARNFLTGIILYVALHPDEEGQRDLLRVRDIISQTWAMPKAYTGPRRPTLSDLLFKNLGSEMAGGAVRRAFSSLLNREDKERSGIISSIERDTAWIDSPQMAKVLKGPSLSLKDAALLGGKYFIVLPPDYFMTHRAWLRLMVTAFAKAMKRHQPDESKPQHQRWRHIVIDEFATLGEMSFMLNDVAVARGFAVKYHFAVQDLAQLKRVYESGWESFINNSFQRFFAVGDLFTADYVSRMLGAATVDSVSISSGENQSRSFSYGQSRTETDGYSTPPGIFRWSAHSGSKSESLTDSSSHSSGWSSGRTVSPVQRTLLTADEVRRVAADEQILFLRGLHPIRCWRPPYWEVFPSLPGFSLKKVLGTIGRAPRLEIERRYYARWTDALAVMKPALRPVPAEPPRPAIDIPIAPEPRRIDYRLKLVAGFAALLLVYWYLMFWPSNSPPAPAPSRPPSKEIASAPSPAPPPVAPPPIRWEPRPAPAPVRTRPPVPDSGAADAMPRGAATRDYFLGLLRENAGRCAPGRGESERAMMSNLVYWAVVKREDIRVWDEARGERYQRIAAMFRIYLAKPVLSREEREEVFELILQALSENYNVQHDANAVLRRLYADGGCPFDAVAEGEYVSPVFADARSLAKSR